MMLQNVALRDPVDQTRSVPSGVTLIWNCPGTMEDMSGTDIPTNSQPASELLSLAEEVAHEAGELLLAHASKNERISVAAVKSSPTDVVTAADTASESLIRQRLHAVRPDDAFLGEEGDDVAGTSGVTWVVDPLDGTVNYLYGIPAYGVSIAATVSGQTIAGVVLCPPTGEVWTAVRGGGAFLNGRRVSANPVTDLGQTLVGTGFWYDAALRARQAQLLTSILPAVRDIRRIGAAAVDLCGVACGRLDAFYEVGLKPWDLAAGLLIAEEAGVRTAGLPTHPADGRLTVAAAPGVFDALYTLLLESGAAELHR
jgi:myo-inositol-1(or 4)-monophosphatase